MKLESSLTCLALASFASFAIACSGSTQIGESGTGEGGSGGAGSSGGMGGSSAGGMGGTSTSASATSSNTGSNGGTAGTGGVSTNGGANTGGSVTSGGSAGSPSCETAADCEQPEAPCQECVDGSIACPYVDCIGGECVGSFPTCQNTTCTTDADCPVGLAPCQVCADGTTACPWTRCEDGSCEYGVDTCGDTNPCEGKQCGDDCSACDPASPVCTQVLMYCNEELECQQNEPACGALSCSSDDECPLVDACPPCADGTTCAEYRCVNGSCQFQCPEDDVCSGAGESCAGGAACCSGLTCCAGVPVPEGEEYCSASDCPDSDVNLKRDFASVDQQQILERLVSLPIATWSYKSEAPVKHIGPMAQDFMAAFSVGASDRAIAKVDADGVAFAAIQALHSRLQALEVQNARLEAELSNRSDCACSRDAAP